MVLLYLLQKEFLQLKRNPIFVGILIFYTLLVLVVFPRVINFEQRDVRLAVVSATGDGMVDRLVSKVSGSPTFRLVGLYPTYAEAYDAFESGDAIAILSLPEHFGREWRGGTATQEVHLLVNAVDAQQGAIVEGYVRALLSEYADEVRSDQVGGVTADRVAPLAIVPSYRFNPTLNYVYYMLPAMLAMLLTMFCGIFPAISIVMEKESGTLMQINVTPIRPMTYVLSKVIPFWIIGSAIVVLSLWLIRLLYGLEVAGSVPLLLLLSFVFIVAMSLFGITISNVSESQQQAMFLVLFFILILFLVSGLFSPVVAMPRWSQYIAYANPLTYYIQASRMVYLRGAGVADIVRELCVLVGFVLLLGTSARLTHRKRH